MDAQVTSLKKTDAGALAQARQIATVGELEQALLTAFPAHDACSWDSTGMRVGNPADPIKAVMVALDPTVSTLRAAQQAGANVLVTHHPLFLDPPTSFLPEAYQGANAGAAVRFALEHNISCMAFHTACDASVAGLAALPQALRLRIQGVLEPFEHDPQKGFGQLCALNEPTTLHQLAARCVSVFGSHPRMWGNAQTRVSSVVTFGGSASSALEACRIQQVDCLICGEVKYHQALEACESGLTIIELGHDVSENPLVSVLAQAVLDAGVAHDAVLVRQAPPNWQVPEALRR